MCFVVVVYAFFTHRKNATKIFAINVFVVVVAFNIFKDYCYNSNVHMN